MKITLTSTGGFAGPAAPEVIAVDVAQLPEPYRSRIAGAARAVDPSGQLRRRPRTSRDFEHRLVLDDGRSPQTIVFHDGEASPQLTALVEALRDAKDAQAQ